MAYRKTSAGYELESVPFSAGRIYATSSGSGTTYDVNYHITDQVGSVRAVVNASGTIQQQSDYYAFGLRHASTDFATNDNRYQLTGKESQKDFGFNYLDFHARQYDPTGIQFTSQDPLQDDYASTSSYVYCLNNPIKFIDLDGKRPRVYTQLSKQGHAFITVGEGANTIIYTYGRYGALDEYMGVNLGIYTPSGEGVLIKKEGNEASEYFEQVLKEGNVSIYELADGSDSKIEKFYDNQLKNGTKPSNPAKSSCYNSNAKVVDKYSLLKNNCVTKTKDGIKAGGKNINSPAISPQALKEYMDRLSQTDATVIKIENIKEFLQNLIK